MQQTKPMPVDVSTRFVKLAKRDSYKIKATRGGPFVEIAARTTALP
ncbi:MAG: hypothetical protein HYZ50_19570 [Deltaproteobacteria bacterium]|nr:hypothetical protein [Deltaproteobacteria bacterium]